MNNNIRRDIVTYKEFPKNKLIRIVVLKDGTTLMDSHKEGRGIYIHKDSIDKGIDKGILEKTIKRFGGTSKDIINDLRKMK